LAATSVLGSLRASIAAVTGGLAGSKISISADKTRLKRLFGVVVELAT